MINLLNDINNPSTFIKIYRLCVAYLLDKSYNKGLLEVLDLHITQDEYIQAIDKMLIVYTSVKDCLYKDKPIKDWCIGLNNNLNWYEPNLNDINKIPIAARVAAQNAMIDISYRNKILATEELKKHLGENPYLDFIKMNNKNVMGKQTFQRAYMLFLLCAYMYYYSENKDLLHYSLSDHQWDNLSRELYLLYKKTNNIDMPVLDDKRFEAGQSLFWLKREDYPKIIQLSCS